jgi:hypothetical protein
MKNFLKLNTFNFETYGLNKFSKGNIDILLHHDPAEPKNANRLLIEIGNLKAELQPSKGLSLGQVYYKGKKLFWDAPYRLPDPDTLDLWSDNVLINGEPKEGFEFLKTLTGGIEFYGLKNWGMPRKETSTGQVLPLHGETSNIPVKEVNISLAQDRVVVEAEFVYNDMKKADPQPWYLNGTPLYKVYKHYEFCEGKHPGILISDTIENITRVDLEPDWGYHITFFPYCGTKMVINSERQEARGGGKLPDDIDTWLPCGENAPREEIGIIHKNLKKIRSGNSDKSMVAVQHPTGDQIKLYFPSSPYFQIWSCRGGMGSDEFRLKNGESLLEKNWDGFGIEIGSSALDHDGNTDRSVKYQPVLKSGEKMVLGLELQYYESGV